MYGSVGGNGCCVKEAVCIGLQWEWVLCEGGCVYGSVGGNGYCVKEAVCIVLQWK